MESLYRHDLPAVKSRFDRKRDDALKEAKSHAIDKSKVRMNFKKETIDVLIGPNPADHDCWKAIAKLDKEAFVTRWFLSVDKVNDVEAVKNATGS